MELTPANSSEANSQLKKQPIMKKSYNTPSLTVVHLDVADIFANSPIRTSSSPADNSVMYGNSRNPIWDEE